MVFLVYRGHAGCGRTSHYPGGIRRPYAPKQRASDLAVMLQSVTSEHHPVKTDFEKEISFYINDLKSVGVIKPSVNADRFASRVCRDVLT
nr:hypothetical protein [uncultured Rhodopila sp.]